MAGRTRSRSVTCGQLMLFAALLFGIVTMHTVGHPAEHGGSPASLPTLTEHVAPAPGPAGNPGPTPAGDPVQALAPGVAGAQHQPPPHGSPGSGAPMSGMDPLSVCLAVLGVWGLALVVSWLLGPRVDGRPLGAPVGAEPLRAPRLVPPPRISVLASVSVLRI